jgi:hypothetical protein
MQQEVEEVKKVKAKPMEVRPGAGGKSMNEALENMKAANKNDPVFTRGVESEI